MLILALLQQLHTLPRRLVRLHSSSVCRFTYAIHVKKTRFPHLPEVAIDEVVVHHRDEVIRVVHVVQQLSAARLVVVKRCPEVHPQSERLTFPDLVFVSMSEQRVVAYHRKAEK